MFTRTQFRYRLFLAAPLTPEQMEEVWQGLSADLSSFIQNEDSEIPTGASPFDPISDVQEEEQKYFLISFHLYFILLCLFGIEERTGFECLKLNH